MVEAFAAARDRNWSILRDALLQIRNCIANMTQTLLRMPENCDPYIFYNRVRIYFSGISNDGNTSL